MAHLKILSKFAEVLKMDAILEQASKSAYDKQKMSEFASSVLKAANSEELRPFDNTADKERPFVPELTWALFIAYRQLLTGPVFQLHLLKAGVSKDILASSEQMAKILKSALPHQSAFIDEHGAAGFPFLVEELERALLQSLRDALNQAEADNDAVAQAARIMISVSEVSEKNVPAVPGVDR